MPHKKILAVETSCDETAAAVTRARLTLSSKIYSQILIHKKWGGVVPNLAKRAHKERIDEVIRSALKKAGLESVSEVGAIAVTFGPGLAPALEVGVNKAKELAYAFKKPLIPVDHMEGHIYSCFVQNSKGRPKRVFTFPYLALLVSGGHTQLVVFKDHLIYEIVGETLDDAVGEALDKAARMLGLGYPGGPALERLAHNGDTRFHVFPRPMKGSDDLNFSYSGLKTSLYYYLQRTDQKVRLDHIEDIAASFQEAVFDSLIFKLKKAMDKTGITHVLVAGGVAANLYLRGKVRQLMKDTGGEVLFPYSKTLYGDNAAMIGVVAYYKDQRGHVVEDFETFCRVPRSRLGEKCKLKF